MENRPLHPMENFQPAFGLDRNFSAHALFLCIVRRNPSHALSRILTTTEMHANRGDNKS